MYMNGTRDNVDAWHADITKLCWVPMLWITKKKLFICLLVQLFARYRFFKMTFYMYNKPHILYILASFKFFQFPADVNEDNVLDTVHVHTKHLIKELIGLIFIGFIVKELW